MRSSKVDRVNLKSEAWWPELESNQRHKDFQSFALPTELSGHQERVIKREVTSGVKGVWMLQFIS